MKLSQRITRFIDVLTGVRFQLADKVRHCDFGRNPNQQMRVVVVATDSNGEPFELLRYARHVCPNAFSELIILQQRTTFLGTEDNVIEKLLMRGLVSPSGLVLWWNCGPVADATGNGCFALRAVGASIDTSSMATRLKGESLRPTATLSAEPASYSQRYRFASSPTISRAEPDRISAGGVSHRFRSVLI